MLHKKKLKGSAEEMFERFVCLDFGLGYCPNLSNLIKKLI